jgi:membrane protein YqaA with SNARE-associated domain
MDVITDYRAWTLVIGLSLLTLIIAYGKYQLGKKGIDVLQEKFPEISQDRWDRLGDYFQRWGSAVVFFSFVPGLALIIPPAAGAYGVNTAPFLAWAFIAKLVRYWLLLFLFFGGFQLIFG